MDVEGAEVRALQGAEHTIRSLRARLCVATEHTEDLFANALAVIASRLNSIQHSVSIGWVATGHFGTRRISPYRPASRRARASAECRSRIKP